MDITRTGPHKKIEFTDELIQKVADLATKNHSAMDISKEIKISYPIIRKIMKSPEYQQEVKTAIRQKVSQMAGLITKVLEQQLEEGNLEAVKLGLKVLGAIDPEPSQASETNQGITVILPGAAREVKSDVVIEKNGD